MTDLIDNPITTITALSHEGRGIAHINGKTTFVGGALPQEEVEIHYLKKHSKFDEAEVVKILKASKDRVEPRCPHFAICAGCSLQHLSQDAQIAFKEKVLLEQLEHFAGLKLDNREKILSPIKATSWGYRRRARLAVKYVAKKGKVLVGFHEKTGRYLADTTSCAVLREEIGSKLGELAELVGSLSVYDAIPQIEVASDDSSIALIFRLLRPASEDDLEKIRLFAKKHVYNIYLQNKGLDSIVMFFDPKDESGASKDKLCYKIPEYGIDMEFAPTDFVQVNAEVNQQMIAQALRLLDLKPEDKVLDLFCGIGNFTLPLAKFCQSVVGVEGEEGLVSRAKTNAASNAIYNTEFFVSNLANDASELKNLAWAGRSYNKILLDPPRSGAFSLIKLLPQLKAEKIVYVSCNPATLARDLKELLASGYSLEKIGILDMFPHTSHVETMAVLANKKS